MNVHWHEGLFLQPHHLQIMQRATQMEIRALRSLLFPFGYGVVDAKLSYDDLANGRLRFERLHVIMPGGQEVRFPEEAQLPSLDIRAEASRGAGQIEVLLSVPLWVKNRANAFRSGEPPDPRVKLLYIPIEARDMADASHCCALYVPWEKMPESPGRTRNLFLRRCYCVPRQPCTISYGN
jgi:type VI secretion system protein ImpJ